MSKMDNKISKKKTPKAVKVAIDYPADLLERIDEEAKKNDRSRAAQIRFATAFFLQHR
jgi:metal-responsive CopG/Arc/MetJ family transcriptional regulator